MTATVSQDRLHGYALDGGILPVSEDRPQGGDALSRIETDMFRGAMRHHAKGVAIITAGVEIPAGFCVTSLASISLDPPLVSFTVGLVAASWGTMKKARYVMIHLLADGQEDLARRFARTDALKFGPGTRWHRGFRGLPVLDDALAWLAAEPVSRLSAGDHALVISQVIAVRSVTNARPLIHYNGTFTRLEQPA
ncbi:MAG TPA: flavin reductase family protein [Streptosporangiaceae bacterium]|jgi:flavin reductase (DIM6/NTAB) family NADH-FMN oxidoreductase RutF